MTGMKRIAVVGTSCSGKSHFAKRIAGLLDIPHVELDALYWDQNWTPKETDDFRELVEHATTNSKWACDGNYRAVRDIIWGRVDTIIWLNFPFYVVFGRAIRRTFTRCFRKTKLYSNNHESFRTSFFSRDSILLWVGKTYWKHRKDYPKLFDAKEWSHIKVVQLRSPREAEYFLKEQSAG